jgi:hypothetical protein
MEVQDKEFYIDSSREYFQFLIDTRQWSGFGKKELNDWIANFSRVKDGEYIACKILNESVGYSDKDVVSMLKEAITDLLNEEIVHDRQLKNGFTMLRSELEYELQNSMEKTLFVPLSLQRAPGESGEAMLRIMTQNMSYFNKMYHFSIPDDYKCERIVIVDDCIGSGEQFKEFWSEESIQSGKKLRDWCKENNIKAYYIALVGFDQTLVELKKIYTDCCIKCVECLSEKHRILEKIMENGLQSEIDDFNALLKDVDINLLGFADMDFAVFIDKNIPDWSLPVLYKERSMWKPLLRRKNSDA